MGHDIVGYNKTGEEIAYVRFTMGDVNAPVLYNLLDANEFNAGVSGSGRSMSFSKTHIEKALEGYNYIYGNMSEGNDFSVWQRKEILNFIHKCLETAKKEKRVNVYFG